MLHGRTRLCELNAIFESPRKQIVVFSSVWPKEEIWCCCLHSRGELSETNIMTCCGPKTTELLAQLIWNACRSERVELVCKHQRNTRGLRRNAVVSLKTLRRSTAMQPSTEYRLFAEQCERLAENVKTERHRKMLKGMAEAWRKVAEEEEDR